MSQHLPIMAIDPGAISGAYALIGSNGPLVADLPVVDKQVDAAAFARFVQACGVRTAIVENVASMPRQGVASTFKFGVAVGIIRGVLAGAGVSTVLVQPAVWKKHHGLIGKDKEASRALAIRLCPKLTGLERKRDDGRAEALLMGLWYLHKRYGIQSEHTRSNDNEQRT